MGYSQSPEPNTPFVHGRLADYRAWLQSTGLGRVLRLDTIAFDHGKATLLMQVRDEYNWKRLVRYADSSLQLSLAGTLFNQFVFSLDLERTKSEIDIDSKDATIVISDEGYSAHTEIWKKMGEVSDNTDIPIANLRDLSNINNFSSTKSMDALKSALERGLSDYFRPFKAKLENYQCKPIYEQNNHLVVEVSNIVDAVLSEGYFEHLQFHFIFDPQPGKTAISYEMFGKYGAGLLWAPQESRYASMVPRYQEQVDHFNLIISNVIGKLIK